MSAYGTPQQIDADLRAVFDRFSLKCLTHLRDNCHRLVRGVYQTTDGRGCIMYLLSELLADDQRIDSREKLKRFFSQPINGCYLVDEDPRYQPARWIVRIWDGQANPERYGTSDPLPERTVMEVLNTMIAERRALHPPNHKLNAQPDAVRRKVRASAHSGRYLAGRPATCVQG